jgi:hypothetical protein
MTLSIWWVLLLEIFSNKLNNAIEECMPMKEEKIRGFKAKKHTIPLDKKSLSKIKRKQRLWTRFLNTRDGEIYAEYCQVRNQVRNMVLESTAGKSLSTSTAANTSAFSSSLDVVSFLLLV